MLRDPQERSREFGLRMLQLINADLDAAVDYMRKMRRGPEYSQGLFMVLDALGRRDADQALAVASELVRYREDNAFYSALFHRLAQENIEQAVARLRAVPSGEAREYALRAIANVWSHTNTTAALAWAQSLTARADRNVALETVLNELANREPRKAIELAQKTLTSPMLERTVARAVQQLTATDPQGAAALVGGLPPGDVQTMAATEVARTLALQDIPTALAWAKTLTVDVTQWLALNNILSVWAQKDPMAVARYVSEMPASPSLDFVARHVAGLLSMKPQEAIPWADSLATESARAAALVMIAQTWAQRDPAAAVNWAASLTDEPLRSNAISGAHSYWMMIDNAAARAWLETAKISPDLKSKLLRSREVQF